MKLTNLSQTSWNRGDTLRLPLKGGAFAYLLTELNDGLIIVSHVQKATTLKNDLACLGKSSLLLPEPRLEVDSDDTARLLRRGALWSEWKTRGGLMIATPGGLITPLNSGVGSIGLTVGQAFGRDSLIGWLAQQGYRRVSTVWGPGEFACRGFVVDLYDPTAPHPLRVEFFDEVVEGVRYFNQKSQRSIEGLDSVQVASLLQTKRKSLCPATDLSGDWPRLLHLPHELEESYRSFVTLWNRLQPKEELNEDGWAELVSELGRGPHLRLEEETGIDSGLYSAPFFKTDLRAARRWVALQQAQGNEIRLTSTAFASGDTLGETVKLVSENTLSGGFVDNENHVAYLTDQELFGLAVNATGDNTEPPPQLSLALEPGQWVTHDKHGVAKYIGTGFESFGGQKVETLTLEFADNQKLILPVTDLERITPWDGEGEPSLDKVGGRRWSTARAKAVEQIEREANEMLEAHAKRALTTGHGYGPPGELSRAFEDTFPFQETRDQLRALKEINEDLSKPFPMDRLLVGDVGHGKTEVALRAAVRVMEQGYQVAFVVPTTVLASQHELTAKRRMAQLPFRVAQLSRLIKPAKAKKLRADVANGTIDLLIGTHSLLKEKVDFARLGLLIIDEEHRFGVNHKEALKKAYPSVDVLSLSATPIPRTLSMGLKGIKDISRIATAPASRGQVYTVTGPWEERIVRQALDREFARGGQAYYLHNRVEDIDELAARLRFWYPKKNIAVAHGQLPKQKLEDVMSQFSNGTVDLLICTTIVESGLDVGGANTLIVDDTRYLGLAQMHQIRGRIGRRDLDGYAYFMYPCAEKDLPAASRERLEALGALESDNGGYRLAIRDLEIRGAGEILGSNQSGFKNRIGYGLYYRMLRKKIAELRGETTGELPVELSWSPRVPEEYIPDDAERLGLYRHLAGGLSFIEGDELRTQLADRCGPLPSRLDAAIGLAVIRREGTQYGMVSLKSNTVATEVVAQGWNVGPKGFISRGIMYLGPAEERGILALERFLRERSDDERRI